MLGHRALDLVVADDRAVGIVEDREEFFAVDVDEEIVLAVEMERRGRVRRGHEQKTLDLLEAGVEQAVEAAGAGDRQQRVLQQARYSGEFSTRLSTIQAPAVSMLFTTSTGSRSTEGIASGSWLIATLPELYSIRSRGNSAASCAMRGSVSSGWPASLCGSRTA
jgi:hypothetical protein